MVLDGFVVCATIKYLEPSKTKHPDEHDDEYHDELDDKYDEEFEEQ